MKRRIVLAISVSFWFHACGGTSSQDTSKLQYIYGEEGELPYTDTFTLRAKTNYKNAHHVKWYTLWNGHSFLIGDLEDAGLNHDFNTYGHTWTAGTNHHGDTVYAEFYDKDGNLLSTTEPLEIEFKRHPIYYALYNPQPNQIKWLSEKFECPCMQEYSNFCQYPKGIKGCFMAESGGYCSGKNADWKKGFYDYQSYCSSK